MIKLDNTEVLGWEHAIRGMRWRSGSGGWYVLFDERNVGEERSISGSRRTERRPCAGCDRTCTCTRRSRVLGRCRGGIGVVDDRDVIVGRTVFRHDGKGWGIGCIADSSRSSNSRGGVGCARRWRQGRDPGAMSLMLVLVLLVLVLLQER